MNKYNSKIILADIVMTVFSGILIVICINTILYMIKNKEVLLTPIVFIVLSGIFLFTNTKDAIVEIMYFLQDKRDAKNETVGYYDDIVRVRKDYFIKRYKIYLKIDNGKQDYFWTSKLITYKKNQLIKIISGKRSRVVFNIYRIN